MLRTGFASDFCAPFELIISRKASQVFIPVTLDQAIRRSVLPIENCLAVLSTSLSASTPGVSNGGFRSCRLSKRCVAATHPPPGAGQSTREQLRLYGHNNPEKTEVK